MFNSGLVFASYYYIRDFITFSVSSSLIPREPPQESQTPYTLGRSGSIEYPSLNECMYTFGCCKRCIQRHSYCRFFVPSTFLIKYHLSKWCSILHGLGIIQDTFLVVLWFLGIHRESCLWQILVILPSPWWFVRQFNRLLNLQIWRFL